MKSTITTKRLILRPTNIEDRAFILELMNTPKWIKNIGDRNVRSEIDAENYIKQKMLPQLEALGYGNYTVIRKTDLVKIGTCGLYNRDGIDGVDIGFAFLPKYEGNGYAFESANKLMDLAENDFNIERISGITIAENTASKKLLEKLGLKFSKIMRLPNDNEDLLLYEKTSRKKSTDKP